MTMAITTVKNNNFETIIHFASSAAENGTITLNTLTASQQALVVGGTPTVSIVKFWCAGELGSQVNIKFGSDLILATAPENAPYIEANAWGIPIITTSDITIQNVVDTKDVAGYIVLRKESGWATKVETATFGSHDDITKVGE